MGFSYFLVFVGFFFYIEASPKRSNFFNISDKIWKILETENLFQKLIFAFTFSLFLGGLSSNTGDDIWYQD
ncbi:MAG: hypothetical protein CM15mP126_5790 [Gammaproteobacteria bacterium]|nr:MAG: hypothetical protein CM15mP126_5790 [Gammaproteobacteria bacterium]